MQTPKIKDVTAYLESIAPRFYQESYDNSGLLTGDENREVKGILVTLDCTEAVVEEAISLQCNLIIAHHPIIFRGLKKLTGSNYVERTVIKSVKHDVAIYTAHTNLDNVMEGVNRKIAEKIELKNTRILLPKKETLSKLVSFIPDNHLEAVVNALYEAGAGQVGKYKNCSFQIQGTGTFQPATDATPFIGSPGKYEEVQETRVEVIFPSYREGILLNALRKNHPYEEVAYYVTRVTNENQEIGSGLIGELEHAEEPIAFLERLKIQMNTPVIRYTHPIQKQIKNVAVCGGAGSFLIAEAINKGADVLISADFKYHEFFDAEGKIVIADVGHYESEQFTKDLFFEVLSKRFSTFAINFSKSVTNPISYL